MARSEGWDTWEFGTAVTTFGGCSSLLGVEVSEFTTWCLDDSDLVRSGVVWVSSSVLEALVDHFDGIGA